MLQFNDGYIGIPGLWHGPGKQVEYARLKQTNFSTRLLLGDAWMKPTNDRHVIPRPIGRNIAGLIVQRHPQLRLGRRKMEIRRHHSYDLPTDSLEIYRAPDNPGLSSESLLPLVLSQPD